MGLEHPLSQYASQSMIRLWKPAYNIVLEREWWHAIATWLAENTDVYSGIDQLPKKLNAYWAAIPHVDENQISIREQRTKHDVKARIEEYNWVATMQYSRVIKRPHLPQLELIHWGMTSADVVDNIALIRMRKSVEILLDRYDSPMLNRVLDAMPLRGIKGPIGTQQDILDLLGSVDTVNELESHLASTYGFRAVLNSIGQVYPRSIDHEIVSSLQAAVSEAGGMQPWVTILNGYASMIANISGDQWNEGDVSTSAVRRVALPGAFLAADCALRGVTP